MKPTREQVIAGRKFWRPRRPECTTPCPGCPFEQGNDEAFARVVGVLRAAQGLTGRVTPAILKRARALVMVDIQRSGDFACHHTVYDVETGAKLPEDGHRQCAGAARVFRAGGP